MPRRSEPTMAIELVDGRLYTADEAAEILRVTRRYVLRLARQGAIERIKPPGRKLVLFDGAALRAYIDSGRQAAVAVGASAARVIDIPTAPVARPASAMTRRRFR